MTATSTTGEEGTVKFGLGQLNNESPLWAKWIFRGYFIISKAVIGYLGGLAALKQLDMSITALTVITLTISLLLDPIMLGFSNLFGIDTGDQPKNTNS